MACSIPNTSDTRFSYMNLLGVDAHLRRTEKKVTFVLYRRAKCIDFHVRRAVLVNTKKIKASGSSSLENLLLELISAYEERIHNVGVSRSRPSRVIQRRNISLPSEEDHTVKYSFSIRGSLDNLKSPVVHLFKTKKKSSESYNRTECARYKLLTKRTNEEFLAYLDKLIEEKTTLLRETDAKIVEAKRKIGKARLAYDQKIVHKPTADLGKITKLASKEYQLRCHLMEKLNDYLAAATNLLLPVESYPNIALVPADVRGPYHLQPRLLRRSVDHASSIPDIPFLGGSELNDVNRLIRGCSNDQGLGLWSASKRRIRRGRPRMRKRVHFARRPAGVT